MIQILGDGVVCSPRRPLDTRKVGTCTREGEVDDLTGDLLEAGFLTAGDQPELYFFRVAGEEVAVGVSGGALKRFQQGRRYLSREEKIDLAGLMLKRQIEAGTGLDSKNLFMQDGRLIQLAGELGIPE